MASPRNGDQGRPDLGVGGGKESAPSVECQKNRLFILHENCTKTLKYEDKGTQTKMHMEHSLTADYLHSEPRERNEAPLNTAAYPG